MQVELEMSSKKIDRFKEPVSDDEEEEEGVEQ